MAVVKEQQIANETVILDGNQYVQCEFTQCKLVYEGGVVPRLQGCHFVRCTWALEEAARRTTLFLRGIYHSGPGGRELVEQTLRQIRMP